MHHTGWSSNTVFDKTNVIRGRHPTVTLGLISDSYQGSSTFTPHQRLLTAHLRRAEEWRDSRENDRWMFGPWNSDHHWGFWPCWILSPWPHCHSPNHFDDPPPCSTLPPAKQEFLFATSHTSDRRHLSSWACCQHRDRVSTTSHFRPVPLSDLWLKHTRLQALNLCRSMFTL